MALDKVPYSKATGMPMEYVGWWEEERGTVDWRPNTPFTATLTVVNIIRGQSAARFRLEASDGTQYEMFMTDMMAMVNSAAITNGHVVGRWEFCKRGQNYGIRYLGGA